MSGRLARSAGVIGLATLTSRVLGLVRDVAQGIFFGTSAAADAFGVATRIPTLLRDLFAEGAMSAAFVPTFTRYLTKNGRESAWRLGSQTINGLIVLTGIIVVLGIVLADPIVRLYAAGYRDPANAETLRLTILLTQVNMPFLTLVAVAAAMMGMLNGMRRFFVPALSPALYNVCFILATITLTPLFIHMGIEPTMALSIGMLSGGLAQVVAQWPALRREGYRHQWILDPKDPGFREVLVLMGPGAIGAAAAQINLLVNTSLATSNVVGAVAGLQYAFRLMYMPIGIFSVSVATAAVPELARSAAEHNYDSMRSTISWALRLMLMLSVPATVGLMVLSEPIVKLIYEYGEFNAGSSLIVAAALMFYAPGIIGYSIVKIGTPAFYSMQDPRTPIVISMLSVGTNLVLSLLLNSIIGYRGLALSTSISANVNAILLLWLLSRRIGGIEARKVGTALLKIAVASAIMGVAVHYADGFLEEAMAGAIGGGVSGRVAERVIAVGTGIGVGVGVLAASAWALGIEEFRLALDRVRARIRR
jgi:putative peptidoglycan lipid II flippase